MEEEYEYECPDMISNLPSEIKLLIVSSIPLKEAVRTCILSTSWRNLWSPQKAFLNFDSAQITSQEASEKLKEIMGLFLRSSHETHQLFKLCSKDEVFSMTIGGTDEELHLDFSNVKKGFRDFNLMVEPSCPCLCNINPAFTRITTFSALKKLHLRSINHVARNFVSALFSSCWVLENLKVEKCSGLESIDIKATNNLQSFVVEDCPNIISITLSDVPKLKSFWYRGFLPYIQLKNTPHLVDMVLNLKDGLGQNEFDCDDVVSFLCSLKDIEILTISGWLLEWLCAAGVIFGRLEFQFNKLKKLYCTYTLMDDRKRDSLSCFLNITPFLEKLFVEIDQNCSPIPCPYFHQYWHEPHLWMDYATVKCNAVQLKYLNTVKLAGFTSEEKDQVLLMDVLLHRSFFLKDMVVFTSPENHRSWSVAKVPQCHVNRIHRLRPTLVVASPTNTDYSFVFTEDETQ